MILTYTIQVCNESRELFSLLNFLLKVKDSGDDIQVVVDTNNVTEKVEIVLKHFQDDVTVHRRPFDTFYENSEFHKSVAQGDYIFHIDADEIPQEFLIKNLKRIIEDTGAEVVWVPRMNIHPGLSSEYAEQLKFNMNEAGFINWPDFQGRVYKNCEYIKWSDELHTKLIGTEKNVALKPDVQLGMWHIKSIEKQQSRWKKNPDTGEYTIQAPVSNEIYNMLV